jgi:hypothetical protein
VAISTADPEARRQVARALWGQLYDLSEAWGSRWRQDRLDACERAAEAILERLEDRGWRVVAE